MKKALAILLAVLMVIPAMVLPATAAEETAQTNTKLNIIPVITEFDMPSADMSADELAAYIMPDGASWIVDYDGTPVNTYSAAEKAIVREWTGLGKMPVSAEPTNPALWDCEDAGEFSDSHNLVYDKGLVDFDNDGNTEFALINATQTSDQYSGLVTRGGGYDSVSCAATDKNGYGVGAIVNFATPLTIDNETTAVGIRFNMYVSDTAVSMLGSGNQITGWDALKALDGDYSTVTYPSSISNVKWTVVLTASDGTTVKYENKTLTDLFGSSFKLGEWNTVTLDFAKTDLAKIDFRNGTSGANFVFTGDLVMAMDDVEIVETFEVATNTALWECENASDLSATASLAYNNGMINVDGDRDKELALIHAVKATDAANLARYGLVTRTGGSDSQSYMSADKNGYGIGGTYKLATKLTLADSTKNAAGVRFDLFVSDTDVHLINSTDKKTIVTNLAGNYADLEYTESIADVQWDIYLYSSDNGQNASGSIKFMKKTLAKLFGEDFKLGEWNTVTLDYSEAETNSGTFDATNLWAIRFYNSESGGNFVFSGDLTVAMDNVEIVETLEVSEPETPAEIENQWISFGYQNFMPVDISNIWAAGALCFELYVSDADAMLADTAKYNLELRSVGGNGDNMYSIVNKSGAQTLAALFGGELQDGWNRFEIPLSDLAVLDTAGDEVTPDLTQINYVRFYKCDATVMGIEGQTDTVMFKNLYFVDQAGYEPTVEPETPVVPEEPETPAEPTNPALWDCEDAGEFSDSHKLVYDKGRVDFDNDGNTEFALINATQTSDKWSGLVTRGGGYDSSTQAGADKNGYGAGAIVTLTTPLTIDNETTAVGIRFNMYVSDTAVSMLGSGNQITGWDALKALDGDYSTVTYPSSISNVKWTVVLTASDGTKITYENKTLTDLFGSSFKLGEWNTVTLDFAKTDLAKIDFRNGTSGANFVFTGDLVMAMDDVEIVETFEVPTNTALWECENASDLSATASLVYNNGMINVDGDRDKELALIHAVKATDAAGLKYYGLVTKAAGTTSTSYGADQNGYGIGSANYKLKTPLKFADGTAAAGVQLDLFVSDTNVYWLNSTAKQDEVKALDGNYTGLTYPESIADMKWDVYLYSSNDASNATGSIKLTGKTFKDIFGTDITLGEWNTVTMDYSKFEANNNTDFDETNLWRIVFRNADASGTFVFDGDLTVAIDNLELVETVPEDTTNTALWECENASDLTATASLNYNNGIMDLNSDGDNELALIHAVQSTDAANLPYYGLATRNGGEVDANNLLGGGAPKGYGVGGTYKLATALTIDGTTLAAGVRLDLFVTDTKVLLLRSTDSDEVTSFHGGHEAADYTDSILDVVWEITLHSSDNAQTSSGQMQFIGTLTEIFGDLKLGEWNTVTLDYSKGTAVSGRNALDQDNLWAIKFVSHSGAVDKLGTFRFLGDLTMAVDNVEIVETLEVSAPETPVEPEEPETPEVTTPDASVYSAQPVLEESFNLIYTVTTNDLVMSNPYASFTLGTKTVAASLTDGTFTFENVLAHRLSDTITTKVTALTMDRELIRTTHTYSIKEYCAYMLSLEDSKYVSDYGYTQSQVTALKRLLSDILYYGAAAQTAINYNLSDLATAGVTGMYDKTPMATLTKNMTPVSGTPAQNGPKWHIATLVLNSDIRIRLGFTATSVEGLTVVVDGVEYTTFGQDTDRNGTTYYYVDHAVHAEDFDTACVATFKGNAEYSVTYAVNDYIARNYVAGNALADLLTCIYNYGVSANAFSAATSQQ